MDQTHLHLVITHLPIFGSLLGGFVLAYGLWARSDHTKIAAYYVFIFSAIGAGIAYLTGEAAEETVETIHGITENTIDVHEDFAVLALISLLTLGVGAVFGLFLTLKKSSLAGKVAVVLFVFSLEIGRASCRGRVS